MPNSRVVVVANKWWECDAILNALLCDPKGAGARLGWPAFLNHPHRRPAADSLPAERRWPLPRALFALSHSAVEIWCISDLLEHLLDEPRYQSSAQNKAVQLTRILKRQPADFVVAIGTAAYPVDLPAPSENGSVVVGTRVFMHDFYRGKPNRHGRWRSALFDQLMPSSLAEPDFRTITAIPNNEVADYFLVPPRSAAVPPRLLADYAYVALVTVNVTDFREYAAADVATRKAYSDATHDVQNARSLETTHGLIRAYTTAPFIFVSGIANRVGCFAEEVRQAGPCAQNIAAAHNAGIVLARIIPAIDQLLANTQQKK